MERISWEELVLGNKAVSRKSWSEITFLPKDESYADQFVYWIRDNVLGRNIPSEVVNRWNAFINQGYSGGVAAICEKMHSILGFSDNDIVSLLWDFAPDNDFLQRTWDNMLSDSFNSSDDEEFSVSEKYSKEDYLKVIQTCVETFEENYADLESLHPAGNFSEVESVKEFGKFLVNKGIFPSKGVYDKFCESDEIHYISSMWYVLDLLYDVEGVDEMALLAEYADLHPDFAVASYNRGRESLEDYFNED